MGLMISDVRARNFPHFAKFESSWKKLPWWRRKIKNKEELSNIQPLWRLENTSGNLRGPMPSCSSRVFPAIKGNCHILLLHFLNCVVLKHNQKARCVETYVTLTRTGSYPDLCPVNVGINNHIPLTICISITPWTRVNSRSIHTFTPLAH